ncbi:hypothetical protein ACHAPJ_010475 [Fusarium lateritium]
MILNLRWWILSRRYYSLQKVELILQAQSISHTIMLAAKTKQYILYAFAVSWLGVFMAAQIALAAMGFCYSIEVEDTMALISKPGKVLIPDMSSIETTKIVPEGSSSILAQQYTANSYGEMSLAFDTAPLDLIPTEGTLWIASDPLTFCGVNYCEYIFQERSVNSLDDDADVRPLVVATNRKVNSTASCESWRVKSGGDGTKSRITLDSDSQIEMVIPIRGGINQTTFMTDTSIKCGPGCSVVSAFEVGNQESWFYACNVSVGYVVGGSKHEHQIGESLRTMAAASIALQGNEVSSLDSEGIQYQIYPAESVFGLPVKGYASTMEMIMARFAIGTVAISAQNNPQVKADGYAPVQGVHLVVDHWDYANLILISITVLQLVLGIAAARVAHQIVVPVGGSIAVAQVLQPLTNRIKSMGNKELGVQDSCLKSRWIYRCVKISEKGEYDLFMDEQGDEQDGTGSHLEDIELL